jgi:hypothetical protein
MSAVIVVAIGLGAAIFQAWEVRPGRADRSVGLRAGDLLGALPSEDLGPIAALAAAAGRHDMTAVEDLARRALEARLTVSHEARDALLDALVGSDDLAILEPLFRVALHIGLPEGRLADHALRLLGRQDRRLEALRLLPLLSLPDERIENAIAAILLESLVADASEGGTASRLTEVAELALFRRGMSSDLVLDALRADLRQGTRRMPLLVLKRMGTRARAVAADVRATLNGDADQHHRALAVTTLASVLGPADARSELAVLLGDPQPAVRAAAASAMMEGQTPDTLVMTMLQERLADPDAVVQGAVFRTLARWASEVSGVNTAMGDRLDGLWQEVQRDPGNVDAMLLLSSFLEALGAYPPSGRVLVDTSRVVAVEAGHEGLRWRATYAYWRATRDAAFAAPAMTTALGEMLIGQKPVITTLAEMAFGPDRAETGGVPIVRQALSGNAAAVQALESYRAHPTAGQDARLLLGLLDE